MRREWRPLDASHVLLFAGLGAMGVGAHLCMIRAFASAQASLLAPFTYVKLLWAAALGLAMFGELPGPFVLAGGAIIVASGLYVVHREHRLARDRAVSP